MKIDVYRLLNSRETLQTELQFDYAAEDFSGFTLPAPVAVSLSAASPGQDTLQFALNVTGEMHSLCARCLAPVTAPLAFERQFACRAEDLEDPDFELPLQNSCLDVTEWVRQELVLETPIALFCDPLCSLQAPDDGAAQPTGDPRWQVLRDLLESKD